VYAILLPTISVIWVAKCVAMDDVVKGTLEYFQTGVPMTMCTVYIGDLECGGFDWGNGDWNHNISAGLSKEVPGPLGHYNSRYHAWVKQNNIECKQTEFGGHVARVTRSQIEGYLQYCYGSDPDYTDKKRVTLREGNLYPMHYLTQICKIVKTLGNQKLYGLVATEF
jgi:hypothetical protein